MWTVGPFWSLFTSCECHLALSPQWTPVMASPPPKQQQQHLIHVCIPGLVSDHCLACLPQLRAGKSDIPTHYIKLLEGTNSLHPRIPTCFTWLLYSPQQFAFSILSSALYDMYCEVPKKSPQNRQTPISLRLLSTIWLYVLCAHKSCISSYVFVMLTTC